MGALCALAVSTRARPALTLPSMETAKRIVLVLGLGMTTGACGSSEPARGSGGNSGTSTSTGGASANDVGGQPSASGGGSAAQTAGTGATAGSTTAGSAGNAGSGVSGSGGAAPSADDCTIGTWPAADPTATGPYETVTENEVGPEAGAADEETGAVPKFTLFRPKELSPNGLCHPVITWGNGTGSTPNLYRSLLGLFASHGFVVIASNSKNVAQGDPRPMLVGVTWVLEQNADPTSALYHHLDPTHIGATGHSQGAMATSQASGDARIVTSVPIEGAMVQRNLHGPAFFFCGGQDDVVGCDGSRNALKAVTTLPAMYAEYLSVDHGSWMSFNNKPSVVYGAVTAWMRLHLMADDTLRPWFYGEACQLCSDEGWQIEQKNMAL